MAGVLFALLFGAALILIRVKMPEGVGNSAEWLDSKKDGISTATKLMPFAGISFLWFIGVVRDNLGRYEDRFFASVLLGSGLLFLAMMFVSTGVAGALVATDVGVAKTYAIRMAAVFMISLATIWLKTGLMPRWLVAVSYLVALGLLIAGDVSMWLTLAFPAGVLVVSVLILLRAGYIDEQRAALA